jgi:hypothetical protein
MNSAGQLNHLSHKWKVKDENQKSVISGHDATDGSHTDITHQLRQGD